MTEFTPTPEEQLAELLAELPPVPAALVQAAKELPRLRADVNEVMAWLAREPALTAHPEAAIRASGLEPRPALVAAVRRAIAAA